MESQKLSKEQITQALTYVQDFINTVPISGYDNHKRAVASIENLALVLKHMNTEEGNGME